MKNCICCLMMSSILYGQLSCGEPVASTNDLGSEQLSSRATTTAITDTILNKVDTNVVGEEEGETDTLELEEQEAIIGLVNELKEAYLEIKDQGGEYLEDIALYSFLGKETEFGTLEINRIADSLTCIYADYFDGEPIGGKLFWVKKGALMAVEIVELTKKITEEGVFIDDNLTYVFYYDNNQLFKILDYQKNKEMNHQDFAWVDENLSDWKLVQEHLNVF